MFRKIFSYSGIMVLSALIPFICLPYLTKYLSMEAYGNYSFWYSVITVLSSASLLGATSSYTTYFNRDRSQVNQVIRFFSINCFFILTSLMLLAVAIIISFDVDVYFISIPIFIIARSCYLFYLDYTIVNNKFYCFFNTSFTTYLIVFLFPILLISYVSLTGIQIIAVMGVVLFIIMCIVLFLDSEFSIVKEKIKLDVKNDLYRFGLYSTFHTLSASLITMSDRFVLKYFLDSSDFAIYALSATLVSTLSLVFSKLSQSLSPMLFSSLEMADDKLNIVRKYFLLYFTLTLFVLFIFSLSIEFVIYVFFSESYLQSINYVRYLAVGVFFQGMYIFSSSLVFYLRMSKNMFLISITIGLAGLLTSFTFCYLYGIWGVIVTFIITWFVYFIVTFHMAIRGFKHA